MSHVTFISEEEVKARLSWVPLVMDLEKSLASYSKKDDSVIQPIRTIMPVPNGAILFMPGYLNNTLGCKIVTSFPANKAAGLPTILANIMLFNASTGIMKVVMGGTEITGWRTAAASIVATKHIHKGEKKVLAILGAGTQGKFHAMGLQHVFNFQEVRIWNRTYERAQSLCEWLGSTLGNPDTFKPFESNEECVKGADVICTATYTQDPIVKYSWLKEGVHINAVGAGLVHYSELDADTYKNSVVITDSMESARRELDGLFKNKTNIIGEVGEVINGTLRVPEGKGLTIFHSLGMAIEDVAAANLVYNSFMNEKSKYEVST